MRIAFLCGPPCAGKTTLAHAVAQPADVVLDYDDIARAIGSPVDWLHPEPYRKQAEHEMQVRIRQASTDPGGTAWVIRSAARATRRAVLAELWDATVYVLNPGVEECLRRSHGRPQGTHREIREWYRAYRPWHGDLDPSGLVDQRGTSARSRRW